MVIAHNIYAMNAQRQFKINTKSKSKNTEKLSSGYKINRSADDAAGLSISEKMRNQIRNLNQGIKNTEDGISLIKTAEQALQESQNILKRMHELAVQAANDVNSIEDRQAIQNEIDSLYDEIYDIANKTQFNGKFPLNGNLTANKSQGTIQSNIQDIPVSNITPKLFSIDDESYTTSNLNNITTSNLSSYSSYSDGDGRIHYVLGEGEYSISSDIQNVVLDVSGNTAIENSSLKNVSILCSTGTNLSINNISIDNSLADKGVGAAIEFQGAGNVLNCYGNNKLYGGFNDYKEYTDSLSATPYYVGCAAINVGDGDFLTVNGTDSSTLKVYAANKDGMGISYGYEASICSSWALGSNFHEDGGSITINGGHILAYSNRSETEGAGRGCIGGGKNISITINGGLIESYGGAMGSIGGGDTTGDGGEVKNSNGSIVINDGIVKASSMNSYAAIGLEEGGTISINGGEIYASGKTMQSVGIGGNYGNIIPDITISDGYVYSEVNGRSAASIGGSQVSSYWGSSTSNGTININGGTVVAISTKYRQAVGKGSVSDSSYPEISVRVNNVVTDGTGIDDGNGHHVFIYSNEATQTSSNNGNDNGKDLYGDLWIQSGANAGEGMFISTVDATTSGIGLRNINVLSHQSASNSMEKIDNALKKVSEYRSQFGAQQNRLEYTIEHELNYSENLQNAESNLRDTDMGKEMLEYSKNSILEQAAQSMISQANQQNQGMLQLLQ